MKDVLCFLNKLDFADKLDNDHLEETWRLKRWWLENLKIVMYPKWDMR